MRAEESFQVGRLEEALADLETEIRRAPDDAKLRVFLFQLLCVLGQWNRALTQLNVAGELDAETLAMVHTYRTALQCEAHRKEVFAGTQTPLLFGEPERWMGLLTEAMRLTADGHFEQSQELRTQALDAAPTSQGVIDGHAFDWIADMDSRLGPMLEAIVDGKYYWIPFGRIREMRVDEPADLRDVVWMPARFVWSNGGEAVGLIPARYPGSEESRDAGIRMARKTQWTEEPGNVYLGRGQRMLATDMGEYALMDVRRLELSSAEARLPA